MLKGLVNDNCAKFEKDIESIKWHLWHGYIREAINNLGYLLDDFYTLTPDSGDKDSIEYKLWSHADELHNYLTNNQNYIVNYSDRYRHEFLQHL